MSDTKYNGWPNKETWLAVLRCDNPGDIESYKAHLEAYLETVDDDFIKDLLQSAVSRIDWDAIEEVGEDL